MALNFYHIPLTLLELTMFVDIIERGRDKRISEIKKIVFTGLEFNTKICTTEGSHWFLCCSAAVFVNRNSINRLEIYLCIPRSGCRDVSEKFRATRGSNGISVLLHRVYT